MYIKVVSAERPKKATFIYIDFSFYIWCARSILISGDAGSRTNDTLGVHFQNRGYKTCLEWKLDDKTMRKVIRTTKYVQHSGASFVLKVISREVRVD